MKKKNFLWTKIIIKIKTRDKKKFTKKFHGGQFSGRQFSFGAIFRPGVQFSRGQFSGGAFFLEPKFSLVIHMLVDFLMCLFLLRNKTQCFPMYTNPCLTFIFV